MIDRARRSLWIFAAATFVPAAALGVLALRSSRTEDSVRRAEADDQARAFLKVAAREIDAELETRAAEVRALPRPAPGIEPQEPPELAESIRRERPDLLAMFHRAGAMEHSEGAPAGASALLVELANGLESVSTRGRLLAAAARCARRAGDVPGATKLYEQMIADHPDVIGESLLPLGASARLRLIELGGDRERLARELLELPLDPASEIVLLSRLEAAGLPAGDRLERARVLRSAAEFTLREGDVRWVRGRRGLWAVFLDRGALRAERVDPVPSATVDARLRELARVGGLAYGLEEGAPAGGLEATAAGGALRLGAGVADVKALRNLSSSRQILFAGLVAFLLLAMGAGLVASLRAAQREVRLARLKSEFISGVSHELRTPLTSIRIFADLLSTPGPAERRE